MKILTIRSYLGSCLGLYVGIALFSPSATAQGATRADWASIEQALGRKGAPQPGDVVKFSFPRGDMSVTVSGVAVKPALALGSWVAFGGKEGGKSMIMGDLVLAESEVGPVMRKLQDGGVEQTALHNHLQFESPRVMYMHISGRGDPVKIASVIHDALALTKTPMTAPAPSNDAAPVDLDTAMIARTLGATGKMSGGVYQVSVRRLDKIMEHETEVPPSMGVATAINFQPTGAGKAAVTGDFVMTGDEVNPVIRALTSHNIAVTAIHSHMLDETPKLFFMHFWANEDASTLAAGFRAALDHMKVKTSH